MNAQRPDCLCAHPYGAHHWFPSGKRTCSRCTCVDYECFLPHWVDDPLIDKAQHRLETTSPLGVGHVGSCSCGGWRSPYDWDYWAVSDGYEQHMVAVQHAARITSTKRAAQ